MTSRTAAAPASSRSAPPDVRVEHRAPGVVGQRVRPTQQLGALALAQVREHRLAGHRRVAEHPEVVVGQLERDPEGRARRRPSRATCAVVGTRQDRADDQRQAAGVRGGLQLRDRERVHVPRRGQRRRHVEQLADDGRLDALGQQPDHPQRARRGSAGALGHQRERRRRSPGRPPAGRPRAPGRRRPARRAPAPARRARVAPATLGRPRRTSSWSSRSSCTSIAVCSTSIAAATGAIAAARRAPPSPR